MRHVKTSHFRLINLAVAVLLITSLLNDSRHELGFLPEYSGCLVGGALVLAVLVFFFVKPTDDLAPIKLPHLSSRWIRIISGVLLVISMLCLVNFYLLNPGYFQPHKKQVLVASFAVMGLFVILYAPAFTETISSDSEGDSRGA